MVISMLYKMRPARLEARRRLEREIVRMDLARLLAGQGQSPGDCLDQYAKSLGEIKDSLNYTGEDEPLATWYGWNEFHEYCMHTYRAGDAPWPENAPRFLVIGGRGECTRLHIAMMLKSTNPAFMLSGYDTVASPGNVAEARDLFENLSMNMGLDEFLVYAWREVEDLCTSTGTNTSTNSSLAEALTSSYAVPSASYTPPLFQAVGGMEIPRFMVRQDCYLAYDLAELREGSGQWELNQLTPNRADTAGTASATSATSAATTATTATTARASANDWDDLPF